MLNKNQISKMIELQCWMNSTVNPDWMVAGNDWMLAGAMELAEAIEHHGWKWWKAQPQNIPALQVELVDYWHFVLSKSIIDSEGHYDSAINFLLPNDEKTIHFFHFDSHHYEIVNLTTVEKLFYLIGLALSCD